MPQSLSKIYIHLVFSTKNRSKDLNNYLRPHLHSVMGGILKSLKSIPIKINSEPDHVHLLFALSRTHTVARTVAEIKTGSSRWIKNFDPQLRHFQWQSGYGAFSIGESMLPVVVRYIENQEAHHRKRDFQEEFRALCTAYAIRWDERYVWD